MAELHVIGEIVGATDFPSQNVFCKWGVVAGTPWTLLEGEAAGQTQVDHPNDGDMAQWSHPIGSFFIGIFKFERIREIA